MKYLQLFIISIFLIGCKDSIQNEPKKELKEIAKEVIENAKNCALITLDTIGNPNVRTMDPFLPDQDFTIWMATNPKSLKVKEIRRNPKTALYYFDKKTISYVTLQGVSTIVNSKVEKEKRWKKEWENFYKNQSTDYLLIKFVPQKGKIISEKHQILGDSITWRAPDLKF